ncbi:hypothetical protein CAPTEDRAFT_182426 [Capitella teleta]|uniref:Leucine-rich repeat-containing protein 40 n=1 Tax=Capitella teleta TaxID=283909 RepID=R7VBE7_CAPTE|nr:hypothetical protein CAPTEDRAFT_182426 [Capitella teleta]|eukprot:ELU16143.1 hypothetical protein CAPTEDRAFT_182426 [Capitella teleta]
MASRRRPPFDPKSAFKHAQKQDDRSGTGVPETILKQGRKSGQLNLSGRSLTEVPQSVWKINIDVPKESSNISLGTTDERWWEQVDLSKLILASNALTSLSEDIAQLPALTVLDVHDNQLNSLPEALCQLENLQKLNLSHNSLKALPESICQLPRLQFLYIQNNQLEALPEDIGRLALLEELDASHNKLPTLPTSIKFLERVMKFNMSNNNLNVIVHEISGMQGLRTLDATHNQLHTLPDDLGHLNKLEQLYLRHNRLTHLPSLQHCTALKELHLGNNAIQGLSEEQLREMHSVSVLDLRDNRLTKVPSEIVLLQMLERLDLTNNNISALPYELGTLPNLKSIVLDGNPLKSIRRDIIMRGTNELKKYLRSRMAESAPTAPQSAVQSSKGTSGIVGGASSGVDPHLVSSSKALDYSEKKVTAIPDELWAVAQSGGVTIVNFSKNQLTQYPKQIESLKDSLCELNLSFNKLTTIDASIGCLSRLVMLDLGGNQLLSLPAELSNASSLRELVISFNRFTSIPSVVYSLPCLEIILAGSNQIAEIDAQGLKSLAQLATLDLQNNDIRQVPPELGLVTQLRSLQLEGNAIRQPRPAILSKGTLAILEYLRGRIPT